MRQILILFVFIFWESSQIYLPEKEFWNELTPLMPTNETLIQEYKCNPESKVAEFNYRKYFPTKISCNDWSYQKTNAYLNMELKNGSKSVLQLKNMDTFMAHVNGHLILSQKGLLNEGLCSGGKFEKIVFNKVGSDDCDGEGVTLQETLYASVKIDGGFCETFCFGNVTVKFSPGIKNS